MERVYRESETGVKWHFSPLGEILFRYLFYFNDSLVNNSLSIRRWWEIGGGRWSKGRGGWRGGENVYRAEVPACSK